MKTHVIEPKSIGRHLTATMTAELDVQELGDWFGETFSLIAAHLEESGNPPVGPPFARYHRIGEGRFRVEAGFPVGRTIVGSERIQASTLPGGTVAITTHSGPYEEMSATYEALSRWIESRGAVPDGDPWEIYFSAETDPPDTWRTDIVQPYRNL